MKQALEVAGVPIAPVQLIAAGTTLREAIALVTRTLTAVGIAGAAGDARIMTAVAAGRRTVDLIAHPEAVLNAAAALRLNEMAHRRVRHEPVSRILGEREFYGRRFEITPATLDPRPDSETLIGAALELLDEAGMRDGAPLRLIDIGTGSGCLIVTLLAELPAATGLATDICPAALAVALRNAERHGVCDRLRLRQCDMLEGMSGRYDLLVSNPPYIPTEEIARLEAAVAAFDPRRALDGGPDGLAAYRRIAGRLSDVLALPPNPAWALFEVGAGQAGDVADILADGGFPGARTWVDLGGHTRCVAVKTLR
ncbi:MAG: peptide chain release factor N(5)-glutamine methyltransferase [Alphaproteobacteria bacterium]|nr:peptide chain release factor N(5)-glutamine methyltransferase [Alphaproteobacteria bacterium]